MSSIAAARKASTAARITAKETAGAQSQLDLAQTNIKMFDAQAKSVRATLNLELQKSPPNAATVQALRNSIEKLEVLRDAEKAKLPGLRAAVNASTKKQGDASAAAFKAEREILDAKSGLEKDQFDAKSAAGGKRLVANAIDAGAGTLDAMEKALKAELQKPGLSADRKRELKNAIASLQKGEAALHRQEHKLEKSARGDDADAKTAARKLAKLEPAAAEAQQRLTEDVTDFVKLTGGSVTTQVKAAVTEADEKANGAGSVTQLDGVLNSKNADRAMNAWQRVDAVANGSAEAKSRLTPEIRQTLVDGVALSRTNDKHGQEGILSQRQAEQAAQALAAMPKARYDEIAKLLAAAGGTTGDAQTERALILKAVAVRADKLTEDPAKATGPHAFIALMAIKSFANDIRGEPKNTLIRSTSPIDLDGSVNESLVRPEDFRGLQKPFDQFPNNDGRFQKYDSTCVPTTGQIVKEEADPIAARTMSKDAVVRDDPSTAAAQQQLAVLKANGADSSTRRAQQAYDRAMKIGKDLKMEPLELAALDFTLRGGHVKAFWADGDALLAQVQAKDSGLPGTQELGWMKSELAAKNDGMNMNKGINDVAAGTVGYDYREIGIGGTASPSWQETDPTTKVTTTKTKTVTVPNGADLAVWDTALKEGHDVPLRIGGSGGGGHALALTDVRGYQPNREYLVADPWSGATNWISEKEMTQGADLNGRSWMQARFGLGWDRVTNFYVK